MRGVTQLLLLLVLGPAQTISGKYYQHTDEYVKQSPSKTVALPQKLPTAVDELCALVEAGHTAPHVYAALGEALLRDGERALAYRAFDRAQRGKHPDRKYIVARKDACDFVAAATIRDEEREARIWVDALQSYERAAIKAGRDPGNLDAFHERYGKPEDDLNRIIRTRRISFLGGVVGIFVGVLFASRAARMRKRGAAIPLIVAAISFATALVMGFAGLLVLGGCFAAAGGLLVSARGR